MRKAFLLALIGLTLVCSRPCVRTDEMMILDQKRLEYKVKYKAAIQKADEQWRADRLWLEQAKRDLEELKSVGLRNK